MGFASLVAHLNQTGDARLFKIPNDPQITLLGAWLRRCSSGERRQLWNVLKDEVSLVSPRPFPLSHLSGYGRRHFSRLGAKPGNTGPWEVRGHGAF